MPKLRTYMTLKSEFKIEAYFRANVLSTRQRPVISRMRNSPYPLEIGLVRYRGIPVENRLCKLCRCEPETEEHVLLKCAKTNDIRQKMVSDINGMLLQNGIVFEILSLADKLKTMLSNVLVAKYVANFTILATEKKYTCKLLDKKLSLAGGIFALRACERQSHISTVQAEGCPCLSLLK